MTDVRCILYEQIISDSHLHTIHGFKRKIYEIQIPSMKLFFNESGIFPIHLGRYKNAEKLKIFYITFESASYLKQALEASKKANKLAIDLVQAKVKEYEGKNSQHPPRNRERRIK